jgi:cytosine/adenosine deaminase-related metal-dependent hydrolase
VAAGRVAEFDGQPRAGDALVDLAGAFVYPGLINAHDHLELNNFPRLKWQERHANARDWRAGFQPRFKTDPRLIEPMAVPLDDRLLLGGLKNLLSGVTTVVQHNPLHPALRRRDYPVRVLRRYRWSHSLLVDGDDAVASSYRQTPGDWPWIIHAAEGTDAEAAAEFGRLERLGCVGANTVLVHGVLLGSTDRAHLLERGGGLIWCPSSNEFMLGTTAVVGDLAGAGRVALATDSRLTGARDLLSELKCAAAIGQADSAALFRMVTTDAAALLRLPQAGRLAPGTPADLFVLPAQLDNAFENLIAAERSSVSLVMVGGQALYGERALIPNVLVSAQQAAPVVLDGLPKWLSASLAKRLWTNRAQEPGLARDRTVAEAPLEMMSGVRS